MAQMLALVLAAVVAVCVGQLVAERTGLPSAVLLTVVGIVYAELPGPNIELKPEVVLTFVIPPLLYGAALNSSLLAIQKHLRVVISLSVVLVLATALLVGVGVDLFVPGVGLAAGVALGAAVSPPDPVAALAIGRRAGLPAKMVTLIEGEGLLNDATALTTFTVAVAAATGSGFSLGFAALRFIVSAAGGVLFGVAIAYLVRLIRSFVRDPILVNSVSLATPFVAYLMAEEVHASGVLAVVVAGLVVGHDTPRFTSGASRLQTSAVWHLVEFLLEGFAFLLIGQQLPTVVRGLNSYQLSTVITAAAVTVGVVLVLRPLWLALTQLLPRRLRTRVGGVEVRGELQMSKREVLVMSWAGTRGVISLAAIFSLPLTTDSGASFPGRDLLLFCAYLVVLVTLVGQGLTFAPLVRAAGLSAGAADTATVRNEARLASVRAALSRLDQMAADGEASEAVVAQLRSNLAQRGDRYQRRLELLESTEDGELPISQGYEQALHARRAVIDAQREELLRWRDAGRLPDASLRMLERELDHEEHTLPSRGFR